MITGGTIGIQSDQDPGLKVTLNGEELPASWAGRVKAIVMGHIADRRWPEDGEALPGLVEVALESDGAYADFSEHELAKWVVELLADAGEIRQHGSPKTGIARTRALERLAGEAVSRKAQKGPPATTAPALVKCPNCGDELSITNRREHVQSGCLLGVFEGVLLDRGYEPEQLDLSEINAGLLWERFGGPAADWAAVRMGLTPYPVEPEEIEVQLVPTGIPAHLDAARYWPIEADGEPYLTYGGYKQRPAAIEHGRKTGYGMWDRVEQTWLVPINFDMRVAARELRIHEFQDAIARQEEQIAGFRALQAARGGEADSDGSGPSA
jgi:hypothetical protein